MRHTWIALGLVCAATWLPAQSAMPLQPPDELEELDQPGQEAPPAARPRAEDLLPVLLPGDDPVAGVAQVRAVFTGRVLGPDGVTVPGAVVVSSAGGQAATRANGSFVLEVDLQPGAGSVQVMAVASGATGPGAGTASVRVAAPARTGATSVGDLQLAASMGCTPDWLPAFGAMPGVDNVVWALAVYDDGTGPALYAGGDFATAGGAPASRIARWHGTSWSALGSGMNSTVRALAVYDDGTGPALYAGGAFTTAGGVAASRIAKWDGASWSALGSGIAGSLVHALAVYDDGTGPALYAGGSFSIAGGVAASHIARWDGASWSALGTGVAGGASSTAVETLAVYDDGTGPALYAGGSFTTAGGVAASRIAKWDGASWLPLGSGVSLGGLLFFASVHALSVYDDGTGSALYAGGAFCTAGGVAASHIARWDGASWSALGSGMSSSVRVLSVYDDGTGSALYAGGSFNTAGGVAANSVAKWDGASWSVLGSGMNSAVIALAVYDNGTGPVLCSGGSFTIAGGVAANCIAKWDGASWSTLASGLDDPVAALAVHDDGTGPALYAGGSFTTVGGVAANHIARWDGASWSVLGSGMNSTVEALAVYDDGTGPALYAGGSFTTAGGVAASRIARWDGASWSALGSGMNSTVAALAVYDDGTGPALYAGGFFTTAGGVVANRIARWDGASWTALGSGLAGNSVRALAVYDDGTSPALYAGGNFGTAGGVAASRIASWDGVSWSAVGGGVDTIVEALAVHDDGTSPALYAGGFFTTAGGVTANRIARWDGASWSSLGNGMDSTVRALAAFDDGTGPALYAGGDFTTAGGVAASRIARWNGASWSSLGNGMGSTVRALAAFDDGTGPALHVGGDDVIGPAGDSFLAKWGCPSPWTDLGFALAGVSGEPSLVGSGPLTVGSAGTLVLFQAAPSAPAILFASLASTPTPFKCGTLVPVPLLAGFSQTTNGSGSIPLGWASWPGGLSGSSLYLQYAIQDASAVCGVALSNALRADVP